MLKAENLKRTQEFMTATPDKYPQGYFKTKPCRNCSKVFIPIAPSHLYCSQECRHLGYENNYFRKKYGVNSVVIQKLFNKQNNVCAICEEVGFKMNEHVKSPLNVDHCHETGTVRGLLCHNCNRALGLFKDNIDVLQKAINYLKGK